MKVKIARTSGFCMGVRRALETVLKEANTGQLPLFTLGPLIHNRQVLDLLGSKGVRVLEGTRDLKSGRLVIRAHGVPPDLRREIKETGLKVVDATCPRVAKVQGVIRRHSRRGYATVIVGDRDHAEVAGLKGYSESPVYVIQAPEQVSSLPPLGPSFVVAQTTQNEENYRRVVRALEQRYPGILVFDTICEATHTRQQEARNLSREVDAMVVVGGFHSGNTRRLVDVCRETRTPTFHVETEADLNKHELAQKGSIGVTAGASTPNWMIKNVVGEIESIRGREESWFQRYAVRSLKFLVLSNGLVGAGAFSFSYAASALFRSGPYLAFPVLAFLYIYAMHVLNRFLDKGASAYNDPERAAFLKDHRVLLLTTGLLAIAASLLLSLRIDFLVFLALCGLTLLGIIYSLPLVPGKVRDRYGFSKIKDIPGSRSLSEALAWTVLITILPLLVSADFRWPAVGVSILAVFLISYARAIFFDILQVQGDLIVGTETLPLLLGERRSLRLVGLILLTTALVLVAGPLLEVVSGFAYVMLLPVLTLSSCILSYQRGKLAPGVRLEFLVESNFVLSGFLAWLWGIIQ